MLTAADHRHASPPGRHPTPPAWRAFRYWLVVYRRSWRAGLTTSVLSPTLFLAAMGLGLGSFVDRSGAAALGGLDYLVFLAPGLLAATAMQSGAIEAMWPVLSSIKWTKQYHAMLATPLGVRDVLAGHLLYMAARLLLLSGVFLVVAAAFGAITSWWAIACLPAGVLVGMTFACPIAAYSASRTQEKGAFVAVNRFILIPMFLFSGTFFPVSQLPAALRLIAYVTPLWHGVMLCRDLALGHPGLASTVGHVLYLSAFVVAGIVACRATFERRLAP
jgi:lipooligosaccharide transport system permease protein